MICHPRCSKPAAVLNEAPTLTVKSRAESPVVRPGRKHTRQTVNEPNVRTSDSLLNGFAMGRPRSRDVCQPGLLRESRRQGEGRRAPDRGRHAIGGILEQQHRILLAGRQL